MNILICSYSFAPNIGGIETISRILATEFVDASHVVTVVTRTPGENLEDDYAVVRNPSLLTLRRLAMGADIIFQNNISLQLLLPTLFLRKPVVVAHQTWLTRTDGTTGWQDRMKRLFLGTCKNVAISRAIAQSLPVSSTLIPNPYAASEFLSFRDVPKSRDLVFLGRLVSDKGCDLLLKAVARLKAGGLTPNLTVIGSGDEMSALRDLTKELGIEQQVVFTGALQHNRGLEVARHRIMVIPSKWAEPFGVVALEGIAAGCAIVASGGGGLPDAVGPCGVLYPNGDLTALTEALRQLLTDRPLQASLSEEGPQHLAQFHPKVVAANYLKLFKSLQREGESR